MTAPTLPRQVVTAPVELVASLREMAEQFVTCPHCHAPVASLLSGCQHDDCRSREIADDNRLARLEDQ